MSLLNRGEIRSGMRGWIAASDEIRSLEQAMRALYPKKRRPSVATMAETVLFAVLHQHEGDTHGTLTNLNNAMARLLDDLEALRAGKAIEGRTAEMHSRDLAVLAKAMDDLDTLQAKIKAMLDTDSSGALIDQLKMDLSTSMKGGGLRPGGPHPKITKPPIGKPPSFDQSLATLGKTIANASPTPHGIWNKGELPHTIRQAAHNLVVAAGGDVTGTVKRLIQRGGSETDAMIIAVLWSERRIAPGDALKEGVEHAAHQTAVTGLKFEWTGVPSQNSLGQSIGLDGIAGGMVVDAKHSNVPIESLPHLSDEVAPPKTPGWLADTEQTIDQQVTQASKTRDLKAEERALLESQHDYLDQMRRQLDWARENGLLGINWVCNDTAHAEAFRRLADRLPAEYKNMQINFTVGGLR